MELSTTAFLAYLNAAVVSVLAAAILGLKSKTLTIQTSFVIAGVIQAAWLLSISLLYIAPHMNLAVVALAELGYHAAWIFCLSRNRPSDQVDTVYRIFVSVALLSVATFGVLQTLTLGNIKLADSASLYHIQGLWVSALNLFCLVRCYRYFEKLKLARLLILSLTVICVHNILYFSLEINNAFSSSSLNEVRALIILVVSIFIALNVAIFDPKEQANSRFALSAPVLFYISCLIFFILMLLGLFYMQESNWRWGGIAYSILMTLTICSVLVLFGSSKLRSQAKVNIRKHFFKHKYDYRQEWLDLLDELSGPNQKKFDDTYGHILSIVIDIFRSYAGVLWLKRGNFYVPVKNHRIGLDATEYLEQEDTHFCHILCEKEWVFLAEDIETEPALKQLSSYLPSWAARIHGFWLIMPLISEKELVGFIALTQNNRTKRLDWEDLDLLKAVGRQVASHIKLQEQTELLTETRQFEAFNKLSAFVMHDLKNIIAQQSLVVANANKHKDNPLFIDDAIETVSNSVQRMNVLLRKLQRQDPATSTIVDLAHIIDDAIQRCGLGSPIPVFQHEGGSILLMADKDSLTMVFVHLIQNSQDATPITGHIVISLHEQPETIKVTISDDGMGMDEEFIREKLFKPFESTKSGKGMGIGVYQARDYIHELGGTLNVQSSVGKGTSFTLVLPLA